MANPKTRGATNQPILCLRQTPGVKALDGPLLRSLDLIRSNDDFKGTHYEMDIAMADYRQLWAEYRREQTRDLKSCRFEDIQITNVIDMAQSINMERLLLSRSDDIITEVLEKYYVNAHM